MSATVTEKIALTQDWSATLSPKGTADFAAKFENNCGLLLGRVLWVAREAFHYDVMKEIVYPLCGDWGQLGVSSQAWGSVHHGCLDISENVAAMAQLPESIWDGGGQDPAPDAFRARMAAVSSDFERYAQAAQLTAQLVDSLIEVGKAAADGIALLISLISETLERIIVEAAIPVVGWVAGAVEAGVFVTRFWLKVSAALRLLEKVVSTIEKVVMTLNKVISVLKILKTTLNGFAGVLSLGNGLDTPDAVRRGWGVAP